nr:copia protein [Tanacetum cinerariifolium]
MKYLEEQTDEEAIINSIKNGEHPLPVVAQVSLDGTAPNAPPTLKDPNFGLLKRKRLEILIMRGFGYGEQDRKAAILYEYETFRATEEEQLVDTYLRYLQLINDLKKCGDVNEAMGYKKKAVMVTSDSLVLVAEKIKVSKCREKFMVQSKSEGTSSSANKKPEYVKSEDKKADEKKRYMNKVKCYNFKKEGHFAKDCKKAKVKDYNYYKTKMLLAKKDDDEEVLLAEDQAWMESSSDSNQEISVNMVFMAKMEKESESEYETSKYYDNSTNYGLFMDNDDDQEIFHDAIEFASEYFNENHIKRIEKANQQSRDLENQNKDLQDKYDVLKIQVNTFDEKNNEFNEQINVLNKNNDDLLAQTEVLQEQLKVKHVVIDTHTESKELRPSLYDERVIGLGYIPMFLTHSNEALKIEKFKRAIENKIEFAYDYGNLNESYVNEKINFSDDYFQEIINPDFEKIDSLFQQRSSLKPYVPTMILENIIIDLEDEVHMMGNRSLLMNFVEKFLRTVRFGNNDFAAIAGYGDKVIGSMTIKKVYYVKVSQVSESSKKDLEDLFHDFYDEYFDASKISKSPTTNVETSTEEISPRNQEITVPSSNTQLVSNNMVPNVNEASTSHNVFNERLEDAYFDASTAFHDPSNVHTFYQPYPHDKNFDPANVAEALKDADWYILDILKRFGMENCDTVPTPMVEQAKLKLDLVGKPVDHTDYRSMIGSLMYLTSSRTDIIFATCMCARYQENPNEHHVTAVKKIFQYLKGTINLGLWYPKDFGFDLTAYSDADHAGCHLDRKTESEYVDVSGCCAQVLWMRTQLTDYGFFYNKVPIYCDSQSAIAISCNSVQHTRTKHIDVMYHFINDHVEKGTIELYFVGTEYQLADLFTKSLPEARFKFLIEKLGMMSRET